MMLEAARKPGKILTLTLYLSLIVILLTPANPAAAKDFLVAIDIGHSCDQPGAISARGVGEYWFNKRIAEGVHARIAAQKGPIKSFLVNSPISDLPLAARPQFAHEQRADLLISIHHDSVQPECLSYWCVQGEKQHYCDLYKGFSLYYSELNGDPDDSLVFAIVLGSEMLKNGLTPSLHHEAKMTGPDKGLVDRERGIYKYNKLIVLKGATMPAVLLECGIIVNRDEELALSQAEYQEKIITSIIAAIKKYSQFICAHTQ